MREYCSSGIGDGAVEDSYEYYNVLSGFAIGFSLLGYFRAYRYPWKDLLGEVN
jgi:hypothetical protein